MRIVFWGSERGCGVTSNMLIVAAYLACRKGYRIVMMELAEEKRGIETCFPKIEECYMEEYIGTLIRRQLYYVSLREWERENGTSLHELINFLEFNMDIYQTRHSSALNSQPLNQRSTSDALLLRLYDLPDSQKRYPY